MFPTADTASVPVRRQPWSGDDAVRLLAQNAVGLAVLVVAAFLAARADDVDGALVWFNVAIAGLVVCGAANGVWLLRVRRNVGRHRDVVLGHVGAVVSTRAPRSTGDVEVTGFVTAPGQSRVHRSDCAFVAGRETATVDPDTVGLDRCEVCLP